MTSTLTAARTERAEEPARPSGPRRDIQGLRAFAVLAVVLDHLTGWPGGGFVGVDMFYVISGFLITGLLLREHERTDQISFVGFYQRRFKRIIPAAVLVIIVTVIASYLTFADRAFQQIKGDALAAMLFVSNWRFESQEINYFNVDRQVSPLQHYWSLSIEEQFYFVWPWVMLAIFAVLLRRNATRRHAHIAVGAVMAAIVIASFAWAVAQTGSDAHSAYFSSLTRVWELGVGAFLAVAVTQLARIPDRLRPLLAWVGLAGMVASLWVISGDQGFPAPAAALPVLATALVIAAGTYSDGRQQRLLWPLTNPASNYVGDASYSLYLWHFPIIIIGFALIGESTADKVVLAAAIATISYFSFVLYENPLRHAQWSRGRRHGDLGGVSFAWKINALAALAVLALVLVYATNQKLSHPPESALSAAGVDAGANVEQPTKLPPQLDALQTQIVAALNATTWPELDPTMDEAIGSPQAPADVLPCGVYPLVDRTACTWGLTAAPHSAVVLGDSVAMTWVNPLRKALPEWSVTSYATFGCPFTSVVISNPEPEITETCAERNEDAVAAVLDMRPDVVFLTNAYVGKAEASSGDTVTPSDYVTDTAKILDRLRPSGAKVVLLAAPPGDADVNRCYTRQSTPADCAGDITSDWAAWASADQRIAENVRGTWVDTTALFCTQGLCPAFVGTTPTKLDHNHMTIEYGEKIAPALSALLGTVV